MTGRLQGKTALVSAAAQGMGRAAVLAFAREGASVVATDVDAAHLKALDGTKGIRTRALDMLDDRAVAALVEEMGAVDILAYDMSARRYSAAAQSQTPQLRGLLKIFE